jgi:DNA modification methylase
MVLKQQKPVLEALESIQANNAALEARFAEKLQVNYQLSRSLVSFQANKKKPGYRWFKYKEGFSEALVQHFLDFLGIEKGNILDPFAGTGTALFTASERGLDGTGIELLPVGCEIMGAHKLAVERDSVVARAAIERWRNDQPWQKVSPEQRFPHLRITDGAFPEATQRSLDQYLTALEAEDGAARDILRFAVMCVLEEISYTRKDGQYLRWDYRSGRRQGVKPFDKGLIYSFDIAIQRKLDEIHADFEPHSTVLDLFSYSDKKGSIEVVQGSCLEVLPTIPTASFDGIITSPPYCNRYDYTRTYALELAMLGVDEERIRQLRQAMVSCTVENREKTYLRSVLSEGVFERASTAFDKQKELQAILDYLEQQKKLHALNNPGIARMVRNYFYEMALVIFECARILKPGASLIMVNDNVRYGGAAIPVDLILSDIAEKAGFQIEKIWVLPTGKGNSSQQMGLHGREELRKCVYIWRLASSLKNGQ